jgi:hypothetical protein
MNSGTEATSTAVRLARGATGRKRIITFAGLERDAVPMDPAVLAATDAFQPDWEYTLVEYESRPESSLLPPSSLAEMKEAVVQSVPAAVPLLQRDLCDFEDSEELQEEDVPLADGPHVSLPSAAELPPATQAQSALPMVQVTDEADIALPSPSPLPGPADGEIESSQMQPSPVPVAGQSSSSLYQGPLPSSPSYDVLPPSLPVAAASSSEPRRLARRPKVPDRFVDGSFKNPTKRH